MRTTRKFILFLLLATLLIVSCRPVLADEDGVDYGYWCTSCGRQHGPGESCPSSGSSGSSSPDEPYDWSQPVYPPATTTTTLTQAQTFAQAAAGYNKEGEELYASGQYDKAAMKFWTAQFNDPNTPLYRENLDKANAKCKELNAERDKKVAIAHERLKKLVISDPSVVDLHDKRGPLIVDPRTVKGVAAKPRPMKTTERADEIVIALLFLTDTRPGGLFKLNPEFPWINPLREPERYKAWEEEERKRLQLEKLQAKAKELDAARNRIIKAENRTITRDQKRIFKGAMQAFQAVRLSEPLTTYASLEARRVSDPVLQKKLDQIATAYWQQSDDANLKASEQALEAMKAEVARFFKRHPELDKPKN